MDDLSRMEERVRCLEEMIRQLLHADPLPVVVDVQYGQQYAGRVQHAH